MVWSAVHKTSSTCSLTGRWIHTIIVSPATNKIELIYNWSTFIRITCHPPPFSAVWHCVPLYSGKITLGMQREQRRDHINSRKRISLQLNRLRVPQIRLHLFNTFCTILFFRDFSFRLRVPRQRINTSTVFGVFSPIVNPLLNGLPIVSSRIPADFREFLSPSTVESRSIPSARVRITTPKYF